MNKIALLITMGLVLVATVTGAIAFSKAVIYSPYELRVVPADEALLALEPGEDAGDICYLDVDGSLCFTFGGREGLPQNSYWEWKEVFRVTNNSADRIKFSIHNDREELKYITVQSQNDGLVMVNNGRNTGQYSYLQPGESTAITISFDIPEDAETGPVSGSLLVKAEAVAVP